MKRLALVASLLALSACAAMPPSSDRVDWRCDGGAAFSLRFNAQGAAEVFAGGQVYLLPRAQTASGARYSNGAVEYWEHQGEAHLSGAAGSPYANCRRG